MAAVSPGRLFYIHSGALLAAHIAALLLRIGPRLLLRIQPARRDATRLPVSIALWRAIRLRYLASCLL